MFVGFNYENTKSLYFAKYEFRANLRYVSANKNDPIIYQAFSNHCIDLMKASKSIVAKQLIDLIVERYNAARH